MQSNPKLDSYKDRKFTLDLSLAVLPFCLMFGLFQHSAKWRFEQTVRVGMSREEVISAAGEPLVRLMPGKRSSERRASKYVAGADETWFYYVEPGSWEFKLTFQEDCFATIEIIGS